MRHRLKDTLIGLASVTLLIVMLASVDPRLRDHVSSVVNGRHTSGELATTARQVRHISSLVFEAAWDQSLEHAPLTVFAVAAVVLVLFMVRT